MNIFIPEKLKLWEMFLIYNLFSIANPAQTWSKLARLIVPNILKSKWLSQFWLFQFSFIHFRQTNSRSTPILKFAHSFSKGQLNSEWIYEYEVIVSPKMPTTKFQISALPSNKLPGQKSGKFLVGILGETMT